MFRNKSKTRRRLTWRSWHKWISIAFTPFIIIFCLSGIILNHRQFFSSYEVSRWWLPSGYHINNWNQSVIKGTLKADGNVIAYGQTGIWKTDANLKHWQDFNKGIADGIDNRKICNVVRTSDGILWCAGLFDAYYYDSKAMQWKPLNLPGNDDRISDITLRGDTVVVLTRSTIYEAVAPHYSFVERPLSQPVGFENKVTLFKTVWMLHSGELFGLCGKLIVDVMAIVIVLLCVTGLLFFILTYTIKHKNTVKIDTKRQAGWLKWNLRWHNRLGVWCIILTVLLSVTGMCLRPPLMVPLALTKMNPMPGTTQSNDNVFHDKLRSIRWDSITHSWLLSTSEGFFAIEDLHKSSPIKLEKAPSVSPMGINVFCRNPEVQREWLVGSFSGLFSWNPITGSVTNYFTGKAAEPAHGRPIASHTVTGWSEDIGSTRGVPVIFEYSAAPNVKLPEMPEELKSQPMSLWNFALELHVGRCYEPFLGSVFSVLFVFISGLLLTLILISGYIIRRKKNG